MRKYATVRIELTIHDLGALRDYALERSLTSGISVEEFKQFDTPTDWLTWAFDAGTPEGCGFQIEGSYADILD